MAWSLCRTRVADVRVRCMASVWCGQVVRRASSVERRASSVGVVRGRGAWCVGVERRACLGVDGHPEDARDDGAGINGNRNGEATVIAERGHAAEMRCVDVRNVQDDEDHEAGHGVEDGHA